MKQAKQEYSEEPPKLFFLLLIDQDQVTWQYFYARQRRKGKRQSLERTKSVTYTAHSAC